MLLITQRNIVGSLCGHLIYTIADYVTVYIPPKNFPASNAESKYRALFNGVDLKNSFYFSYTYNLTRSLQYNYTHCCHNAQTEPVPLENDSVKGFAEFGEGSREYYPSSKKNPVAFSEKDGGETKNLVFFFSQLS
jgi:hypothetical protein